MDDQTKGQIRNFLAWSAAIAPTEILISYKAYIRLTGSRVAADLLALILFWHKPNLDGETKLRVEQEGILWYAKSRKELAEELFYSETEIRGGERLLEALGIIARKNFFFAGANTGHFRIEWDRFLKLWERHNGISDDELSAILGNLPPKKKARKKAPRRKGPKQKRREPILLNDGTKAVDHPANAIYYEAAGRNLVRLMIKEICELYDEHGEGKFQAVLTAAQARYGHLTNLEMIKDWLKGEIPYHKGRQQKEGDSPDLGGASAELEEQWAQAQKREK